MWNEMCTIMWNKMDTIHTLLLFMTEAFMYSYVGI